MSVQPRTPVDPDRRLAEALRGLPRVRARDGFTDGVLDRLEAARRPAVRRWRPALAIAAALLLALAFGLREWSHARERRQATERLASLRAEYRLLVDELERLSLQADSARPVLYLGGNERVELVVDLARLSRNRRAADLRPASTPPTGDNGVPTLPRRAEGEVRYY